jgi:gamma-butyrobetaine dioxygenase
MTPVETIGALFAGPGARDYLGEPVTIGTHMLQGGPMTQAEVAAFEALPYALAAVAVRRWDDQAKDPAVTPPEFSHFAPLLGALLRS